MDIASRPRNTRAPRAAPLSSRHPHFRNAHMNLQIGGKLALVSGSTAGIGFAIAGALAAEGAHVIVNGRTQKAVDEAVQKLTAETKGALSGFAGDLSQAAVAEALANKHPGV